MNIKFFSKEHLINDLLEKILFNFELGVFYRELREKTGLIYSIKLYIFKHIKNLSLLLIFLLFYAVYRWNHPFFLPFSSILQEIFSSKCREVFFFAIFLL